MKNTYILLAVVAALAFTGKASAQNLDPTVVVDRAYEGKLMEVHKPVLEMSVPDSVMRFDLDFDYSVFDRPYKGSYEFSPYLLSMKPSVSTDRAGKFYLRAGAGYQLRPELDLVWSPKFSSESFTLDVYADHRSFIGNYNTVRAGDDYVMNALDDKWKGYDLASDAGVAMSYDWNNGKILLDAGYYGVHQKDVLWSRGYNAADVSFEVASKDTGLSDLMYGFSADYRYAADSATGSTGRSDFVGENNLDVGLKLRMGLKQNSAVRLAAGMSLDGYTGYVENVASDLYLTAGYIYRKGILQADLGAKLAAYIVDTTVAGFKVPAKNQYVYPDVNVRLNIFPKFLSMFANVTGGPKVNSYSSILARNHHAELSHPGMIFTYPEYMDKEDEVFGWKMGISVERVSASAGFDGRIGKYFSYSLYGGYTDYAAGMLDAVYVVGLHGYGQALVVPGLEYAPYKKAFASFRWMWMSERFSSEGGVTYTNAYGDAFDTGSLCLKPAAMTGDVSFMYNYRERIYAGVNCEFSTLRTGGESSVVIPGYADLGVSLEYVTSRGISFWVKGGNLLGMTIQRNPAYAVKDPYFTLGICLKL